MVEEGTRLGSQDLGLDCQSTDILHMQHSEKRPYHDAARDMSFLGLTKTVINHFVLCH